jgi:hypothetical protein
MLDAGIPDAYQHDPGHRRIRREGQNHARPALPAQAAPRNREKLSNRPMDLATVYRVIQGYLRRLSGAVKKERIEDGSEVECCVIR